MSKKLLFYIICLSGIGAVVSSMFIYFQKRAHKAYRNGYIDGHDDGSGYEDKKVRKKKFMKK